MKLLGDNAVLTSLQVRVLQASLQDIFMCIFSVGEGSVPPGGTAAAALGLGCCRSDLCTQAFEDIYKLANTWYLHLLNLISGEHLRSCAGLLLWW